MGESSLFQRESKTPQKSVTKKGTLLGPYGKQLCANKLDEMDTLLERHELMKLIQEGRENLNRLKR